jgi:hypothetical protein
MRTLIAIALMALFAVLPAAADPPRIGVTHMFKDPVFTNTVFCDTADQIEAIAASDDPAKSYYTLFNTPNAHGEPTCAAGVAVGVVQNIRALPQMVRDGVRYRAWALQVHLGRFVLWALYLEKAETLTS